MESNSARSQKLKRIALLIIGGVIVEGMLFGTVMLGPALASLVRPGYVVVAIAFVAAIWHAARRRPGQERRQPPDDRRDGDRREAVDGQT